MSFSSAHNLKELVGVLVGYINLLIPLLVALVLVLFLYSGFRYVLKASESHGKGPEREAMLWGLVILFLIVSVWGVLRLMCNTFFHSSSCNAGPTTASQSTWSVAPSKDGGVIQIIPK